MKIDKNEVLRYLGHRGQEFSKEIDIKIDFLIDNAYSVCNPKSVWGVFEPEFSDKVCLKGTNLVLEGQDILKHLKGAKKVAVLAVTLGINAEREILKFQQFDMVSAVIADAVFDAYAESLAESTEQEIVNYAKKLNLYTNWRFSPGYGDFPLDIQKGFADVLNLNKTIGLTVTENNLLIPRKSVTAVMGLFEEEQVRKIGGCENCNLKDKCKSKRECKNNV